MVGDTGKVYTYEIREDFAKVAQKNIETFGIDVYKRQRLSSTPLKTSSSTIGARIIVPSASIKNAIGVRPVSYTHLDVYKRQWLLVIIR